MLCIKVAVTSEFVRTMFQAAQLTHERFLTIGQNISLISEVRGSLVWQISKKCFVGVIYGQKSLIC